jgi:hypothetical protein
MARDNTCCGHCCIQWNLYLSFPDNSFSRIRHPISMVPERILFQLWLPHLLFSRIHHFFFRPPTKTMNRGFTVIASKISFLASGLPFPCLFVKLYVFYCGQRRNRQLRFWWVTTAVVFSNPNLLLPSTMFFRNVNLCSWQGIVVL